MAHRLLPWFRQRKIAPLNQDVLNVAKSGDAVLLDEVLQRLCRAEGTSVLSVDEQHMQSHSPSSPTRVSCGDGCLLPARIKKLLVTLLIIAVEKGHLDSVKLLLKYGADVEGRGEFKLISYIRGPFFVETYEGTPMCFAAVSGNVEILRCLLENGADINAVTADGKVCITPLIIVAHSEQFGAVTFLINQGADVNFQDKYGYTALHYVAKSGSTSNINALNCLINHGADINAFTEFQTTALMLACAFNNVNAVKCLLHNSANVDLQDRNGETCLKSALRCACPDDRSSLEILSFLLKSGVDVSNARRNDGVTLLMQATCHGSLRDVHLLIEHGANVDFQDQNGDTALHYATHCCDRYSEEIVSALLTGGSSHLCNNHGLTPLLAACNKGNTVMVEHLIRAPSITKEQRIDALELLGASLALEPSVGVGLGTEMQCFDFGCWYIKWGMKERFADPSHPLLKKQMKPIEAYQNRKECQTLEELDKVSYKREAMIMESLIIRERIIRINNVDLLLLVRQIRKVANSYRHSFSQFLALKRHAIKIVHNCNYQAASDLQDIIKEVSNKQTNLVNDDDFVEKFDEVILAYEREVQIAMMNKKQPPSLSLSAELISMISKFNGGENGKLPSAVLVLKTLCNFNPRDRDGNTLLHQLVKNTIYHRIYHHNKSCSHIGEVKALLNAGFNVNAINNRGYTPLHLAVNFSSGRKDANFHLEIDMLKLLIDEGAHHDFVNDDGKTPMDMAETDEARMILSERRKLELKCICARAVKKFGIPYMGLVPKTLEKYISMH